MEAYNNRRKIKMKWQVLVCSLLSLLISISTAYAQTPTAATLISPTGVLGSDSPTYTWNAVPDTSWYFLWVDDSSGNVIRQWYRSTDVGCVTANDICSVTPDISLSEGAGHWWIQTWNTDGYGLWSDAMSIAVGESLGKVTLTAPSGMLDTVNPTYTWDAVNGASWYFLWVNNDQGDVFQKWYRSSEGNCESGSGTCSVTPELELEAGTDYQWWIQTWNESEGSGPWSDAMRFSADNGGGGDYPGGEYPESAQKIPVNQQILLRPAYDIEWNNKPQKYGNYKFDVEKDGEVTLDIQAAKVGGSWMQVKEASQGSVVTEKWVPNDSSGTTDSFKVKAGETYRFFINKNGANTETIGIKVNFSVKEKAKSYVKDIRLPKCDPDNPDVFFIRSNDDWSHINGNKTTYCVEPGDYSSLGEIEINASGTSAKPRYIILNNGNDTHPIQLPRRELAKYTLRLKNADYWIIDRQANWEEVSPFKGMLYLDGSRHNIMNRGLSMDTSAGITLTDGSHFNTIQNFHMEKTQWSVDYATANKTQELKDLDYNKRIFADLAAIGFKGVKDGESLKNNIVTHNEIINYVDAVQLVRFGDADNANSGANPRLDGAGTVIADNLFYTTSLLYTDGHGNFMPSGERAITENALDFKFGSLDQNNPVIVTNNFMFGYRFVDNTYSNLGDNGNAMVFHYGAGNMVIEGNYIFDSKNGFAAGGPRGQDPAMYDITMRDNVFYDMKENIDHIYGTRAENSFDGTKNVLLENNVFGKVGVYSLHAYNTDSLMIRGNSFVDTKPMYFAPDFMDLRSKDLVIKENVFYNMTLTGIPSFATESENTQLMQLFDWSPYLDSVKTRIFTDNPTDIKIR